MGHILQKSTKILHSFAETILQVYYYFNIQKMRNKYGSFFTNFIVFCGIWTLINFTKV